MSATLVPLLASHLAGDDRLLPAILSRGMFSGDLCDLSRFGAGFALRNDEAHYSELHYVARVQ
jgi:hypothetical protein